MTTRMGFRSSNSAVGVSYLLLAASITANLVVRDVNAFSSPQLASIPKCQQPLPAAPTKRIASNGRHIHVHSTSLFATDDDENDDDNENEAGKKEDENSKRKADAERFRQQAEELREQIRKMEAAMPEKPVDPERAAVFAAAQEAAADQEDAHGQVRHDVVE